MIISKIYNFGKILKNVSTYLSKIYYFYNIKEAQEITLLSKKRRQQLVYINFVAYLIRPKT